MTSLQINTVELKNIIIRCFNSELEERVDDRDRGGQKILRHLKRIQFINNNRKHQHISYRPARSTLMIECGMAKPSNIGTACVTPSPESNTTPVVLPVAYL